MTRKYHYEILNKHQSAIEITQSLPESLSQCILGAIPNVGVIYDRSPLFSGFSIQITSSHHLASDHKRCLESLDGISRVWVSQTYTLASSAKPAVNHRRDVLKQKRKLPIHTKFNSSIFHELTGVNELHARGITGRGVAVAVLDTGIDYLHTGLGGGFGPDYKVRFGYDFVGDGYLNGGGSVESPDPYTECHYHGTHVSGIIGGNHPGVDFFGVAPDVKLEVCLFYFFNSSRIQLSIGIKELPQI